ncbi:MAG: hypothetical protein ABMA15_31030, partial [Vicinamibacterales bacterium]
MLLLSMVPAACRRAPSLPFVPPLGVGARVDLTVPGALGTAPVVTSATPFVAVAWATRDTRGAMVYVATSSDNGATFSPPTPVSKELERVDEAAAVFAEFELPAPASHMPPAVRIEWRAADGERVTRLVRPWTGRTDAEGPGPRAAAVPNLSCDPFGELLLVSPRQSVLRVSVNHGQAEWACSNGDVAATVDTRHWIHAAWVGRGDAGLPRQIFYAASSDGQWFGETQLLAERRLDAAHVRVTTDPNDTIVAVWDEAGAVGRTVSMRQIIPAHHGLAKFLSTTQISDAEGGHTPSVASIAGGVIVAWVDGRGTVAVKRVGLDAICM